MCVYHKVCKCVCLWDLPDAVMGGLNISALHAVTPYCVLVIKKFIIHGHPNFAG